MATVLVLDGLHRKSLAVTRWLGVAGHRVLTAENTYASISRFSRFARRSFVYPSPASAPASFLRWLEDVLDREAVTAVIPTDDDTTAILSEHRTRLADRTALLVPPWPSFRAMRDKAESAQWFQRAGIPHPPTRRITDLDQVSGAAAELGFPLLVKPRITAGSRGMQFVERAADLETAYAAVHRQYPWPILQAAIAPGPKYHVCLLYDQGGHVAARYVQRELRQYPIRGGPSTMQESVERPDLLALLEPLFTHLPWVGPLHADVMADGRTGVPYVLEVNPRYWQSLHVAHRAGINFSALHLALALGEGPPAPPPARVGVRGRALVPFDLLAYLDDSQRSRWRPSFWSPYGSDTWDDLLSWSDPGPTLGFAVAVLRFAFDGAMWRAVLRSELR